MVHRCLTTAHELKPNITRSDESLQLISHRSRLCQEKGTVWQIAKIIYGNVSLSWCQYMYGKHSVI